jgi:hypothetical protein
MKFEKLIDKSIKAFLDGKLPEDLMKVQDGSITYTPEYMDELEADFEEVEPEEEVSEDDK